MSTDLTKLIDRIADAGGPSTLRDHDEWKAHLKGREGLAVLWTPEELRPGTSAEALLIHALKLDARARGFRLDVIGDKDRHSVYLYSDGHPFASAVHDDEATAWCLAWLAAFENPDADQ